MNEIDMHVVFETNLLSDWRMLCPFSLFWKSTLFLVVFGVDWCASRGRINNPLPHLCEIIAGLLLSSPDLTPLYRKSVSTMIIAIPYSRWIRSKGKKTRLFISGISQDMLLIYSRPLNPHTPYHPYNFKLKVKYKHVIRLFICKYPNVIWHNMA